MKLSQLGEFGLIELIKKTSKKRADTIIGIGDDCAVVKASSKKLLLLTTDALVENVHFKRKGLSFFALGQKALLANISDIAAMGGLPTHAVVTVGFPKTLSLKNAQALYNGLESIAKKNGIDIVGGDTVASPKGIVISITLMGEVEKKYLLKRTGAKPNDLICVTGNFGGEAANQYRITHYALHISRINEARIIAKSRIATSMIDSSDGLIRSVRELCKASKVGANIWTQYVPIANGANLDQALYGGEEYELVFTVPKNSIARTQKLLGEKVTIVGEITPWSKAIALSDINGRITKPKGGYEHFN